MLGKPASQLIVPNHLADVAVGASKGVKMIHEAIGFGISQATLEAFFDFLSASLNCFLQHKAACRDSFKLQVSIFGDFLVFWGLRCLFEVIDACFEGLHI